MIIRNSARCEHCYAEIVSRHRHDFVVHYCDVKPAQKRKWVDNVIVDVPGETTWSFAVDGGEAYLKRCGDGFVDTSILIGNMFAFDLPKDEHPTHWMQQPSNPGEKREG